MTDTARPLSDDDIERIQKEFKIPVDSMCPGTYWIVSLDRETRMPTDKELLQIWSYREFLVGELYNPDYAERILAKLLPKEAGHNTLILCKGFSLRPGTEAHWFRRKISWHDPVYAPNPVAPDYRGLSLVEVLDAEQSIFPERWGHWQATYSDIFA